MVVAAFFAGVLVFASPALTAEPDAVGITIYSRNEPGAIPPEWYRPVPGQPVHAGNIPGYAMVKQERSLALPEKRSRVRFQDVAALIDPTTVRFESLTAPEQTKILEQSFQFDLVGTQRLMERYLDRTITVEQAQGDAIESYTGTLLSTQGGLVLQSEDGSVEIVHGYSRVSLPELPGGLMTRPTLVWEVQTAKTGEHRVRVSYETQGVTWWADYNLVFAEGEDANSGILDVGAWVSILNRSGGSYEQARLKLVAGDVQRAERAQPARYPMAMQQARRAAEGGAAGFEEKAFFEYHLYTLGRPTTIPDRSTQQLELFPNASGVPTEKVLVYYGLPQGFRGFFPSPVTDRNLGTQSNRKVDVYLRFRNEEKVGLGIPLPSGRVRVSKLDPADGSLELIGEDTIEHTPKDEEILIKLGSAFDVVGERKQMDFQIDNARDWMEEEIEIRLRNHKDEPVRVIVKENLYRWTNWKVLRNSHDFEKIDARTIHFPVSLKPDEEAEIRYRVRYSW